ncbi:hypothetical protein BGZ49_009204 [Haplosporangium sp. Z 27]|nr:hypothetical protein BGZ49_009204 [Haplosporangium sp. Z 27]
MSVQSSATDENIFKCTQAGCTQIFTVLYDWSRHVRKCASTRPPSGATSEGLQVSGVTQTQQDQSMVVGKPLTVTQSSSAQQKTDSAQATVLESRLSSIPKSSFSKHISPSQDEPAVLISETKKHTTVNDSKLALVDDSTKDKKSKVSSRDGELEKLMLSFFSRKPSTPTSASSVSMERKSSDPTSRSQKRRTLAESLSSLDNTSKSLRIKAFHPADETLKLVRATLPHLSPSKAELSSSSTLKNKRSRTSSIMSTTLIPKTASTSPIESTRTTDMRNTPLATQSARVLESGLPSEPIPSTLIPKNNMESSAVSDIEVDSCTDMEDASRRSEIEAGEKTQPSLKCELRLKQKENDVRGKAKAKDSQLFTHSCDTSFETEELHIQHYLEHIIAQGPYLQCPTTSCRMLFLNDSELEEHDLRFHLKPTTTSSLQPTPQKSPQQHSKQRRTRLQSKGGKVNNDSPAVSTIGRARANAVVKSASSQKRKPIKVSRSSRSGRNIKAEDESLLHDDTPPIVLGRLLTR